MAYQGTECNATTPGAVKPLRDSVLKQVVIKAITLAVNAFLLPVFSTDQAHIYLTQAKACK